MGKTYTQAKIIIAFAKEYVHEIYAGEYYPRCHPSAALSLEYLNFYREKAAEKTIALVAGIYTSPSEADRCFSF